MGQSDLGSAFGGMQILCRALDVSQLSLGLGDALAGTLVLTAGVPGLALGALIANAINAITGMVGTPATIVSSVQALVDAFQGQTGSGSIYGSFGFTGGAASGLPRSVSAANVAATRVLADMFSATSPLVSWQELPTLTVSVPASATMLSNRAALTTLIRQTALATMAAEALTVTYDNAAQAIAIRNDLANRLDAETLIAGTSATTVSALLALRVAVVQHLTQTAAQLPSLTTFQNGGVVPALVLASRLYDDPTRADEIVAYNGVRNPGFVPAGALTVATS